VWTSTFATPAPIQPTFGAIHTQTPTPTYLPTATPGSGWWLTQWYETTWSKPAPVNGVNQHPTTTGHQTFTVPIGNQLIGISGEIISSTGSLQYVMPHLAFDSGTMAWNTSKNPYVAYPSGYSAENKTAVFNFFGTPSWFQTTASLPQNAGYVHNKVLAFNSGWSNAGSITFRFRYLLSGTLPTPTAQPTYTPIPAATATMLAPIAPVIPSMNCSVPLYALPNNFFAFDVKTADNDGQCYTLIPNVADQVLNIEIPELELCIAWVFVNLKLFGMAIPIVDLVASFFGIFFLYWTLFM
jgi:hypothetical protein